MPDPPGQRVDANVVLRYLTGEPPDQAARAVRLFHAVADGELTVLLDEIVAAEVVWTLGSFYRVAKDEIVAALRDLLAADGVASHEKPTLLAALAIYGERNVKFIDALLAARMLASGRLEIWSFDRDFDRVPGIRRVEPR